MSASLPTLVAICGKGRIAASALSFAVHYLKAASLPIRIVACPNSDDKGYDTWQESLTVAAARLLVPRTRPAELESERGLLLVSLEYDRLIRVRRFASQRLYNIHFSALPKYRGVYTSIWPLLNGERESGVSLHEMDEGADTGRVVGQRRFPLPEGTTARELYDYYMRDGLLLFQEWFPRLVREVPPAEAQDESRSSAYTRASLDLSRLEIDPTLCAADLCRFVRAFVFPEYQLPRFAGRAVRAATALGVESDRPPGTVLHDTPYSAAVVAGDEQVVELIWG